MAADEAADHEGNDADDEVSEEGDERTDHAERGPEKQPRDDDEPHDPRDAHGHRSRGAFELGHGPSVGAEPRPGAVPCSLPHGSDAGVESTVQIGVLGGTGPAGRGLGARLASVGHDVVLGSRDPARAAAVVTEIEEQWGERVGSLAAGTNADAAAAPDVVVVATTWEAAIDTVREYAGALDGKVVIAMANGLVKEGNEFRAVIPSEGSLAQGVQAAAPGARVVAAFQHVPAHALAALDTPIESDVIVCGDDRDAQVLVLGLVAGIPNLRGFDGGSLGNAVGIETFGAVLLSVNVRHKGRGTLKLLGVDGYQRSLR
jgi:NADPH-dependent F420 reductase